MQTKKNKNMEMYLPCNKVARVLELYLWKVFIVFLLITSFSINELLANEPNSPIIAMFTTSSALSYEAKTEGVVATLKAESWQKSMSRLDEIFLYIWPGELFIEGKAALITTHIPLEPSVDEVDLVAILGNRRFLKVFQDLSLMEKEEIIGPFLQEFTSTFSDYLTSFNTYMNKNEQKFKSNLKAEPNEPRKGLGFNNYISGSLPTLRALRYKVLALTLLAGNLEIKEAKPVIKQIVEFALEQRNVFYDSEKYDKLDAVIMLSQASLYNRAILAAGILGTSGKSDTTEVLSEIKCEFDIKRLACYDASVIKYDLPSQTNFATPDYSKGELTFRCIEELNDSEFDRIVEISMNKENEIAN